MSNKLKILFFVNGATASKENLLEAQKFNANVQFRNATKIGKDDKVEPCHGVAGAVPETYKGFPKAEDAIADFEKKLEEALKETGEEKAPAIEEKEEKEDAKTSSKKKAAKEEAADKKDETGKGAAWSK